jgi:hypothetical protein
MENWKRENGNPMFRLRYDADEQQDISKPSSSGRAAHYPFGKVTSKQKSCMTWRHAEISPMDLVRCVRNPSHCADKCCVMLNIPDERLGRA